MARNTLVSVVIPTHNRAKEIPETVESVLTQTAQNVEVVVVDDASTDDTPAIMEQLVADNARVRFARNASSLGPGGARNRGVQLAEGDLLAFCDDDDRLLPGALATMVEFLDQHAECGAVSAWHEVFRAASNRAVVYRGPLSYRAEDLLWSNVVAIPFLMVRRSAFAEDPRYDADPQLAGAEDWDLCIRCANERPMRTVPSVLYQFRQHGGQRVTKGISGHQRSRRALLAKHQTDMTSACRLYHEAILLLQDGQRSAVLRRLVSEFADNARDSSFVATMILASTAASRVGIRFRDPGLSSRVLCEILSRRPETSS
jgi:glycosyltransferase involved in cell wall biosynthesis